MLTQGLPVRIAFARSTAIPALHRRIRSCGAPCKLSRAADELNLTPSAISHAIKALEQRLGQQLFARHGRAVSLTPAGQTLAARVRLSLGLLADAFDTALWKAKDRLVVSTLAPIAERILLPAMDQLQQACPGMMLDLRCSTALADCDRDIDVAIRFGPGGWRGVQSRFLGDEILFPVISPKYRGGSWPLSQAELSGHMLIHHPESSWRLWLDPAQPVPSRSGNSIFINDSAIALKVAAEGHGIALARGRLVAGDLAKAELVRLFDRAVPAEYGYWAVWSGSSPRSGAIAGFVRAVAAAFAVERDSQVL